MPPPPSRRPGAGGGRSESTRSASGRACSPQPGPLGLGSGVRAALHWSCSEFHGRSSPAHSGTAEDDWDSVSGSVDLDRDDSFRAVFRLIREFHSMA